MSDVFVNWWIQFLIHIHDFLLNFSQTKQLVVVRRFLVILKTVW